MTWFARWGRWLGLALIALGVALFLPPNCCPGGCCRSGERVLWEETPGALPPVDDQGPTLTCVGWSCGYYAKTIIEKARHPTWDVSLPQYQFSPSWVYNTINDFGSTREPTLQRAACAIQQFGCATRATMHFTCDDKKIPTQAAIDEARTYKSLAPPHSVLATRLEPAGPAFDQAMADFKKQLLAGRPIVFMLNCTHDFFDDMTGTKYWVPTCAYRAKHAIVCVGFDDGYVVDVGSTVASACGCGPGRAGYPSSGPQATKQRYLGAFRLRNSFGTCWRDNGSVWVPYEVLAPALDAAWVLEDGDFTGSVWSGCSRPRQWDTPSATDDPEPPHIACPLGGIICKAVESGPIAVTFHANEKILLTGPLYAAVPSLRCATTTAFLDAVGARRIAAQPSYADPDHIGAFVDVLPFELLLPPDEPVHFRVVLKVRSPEGDEVASVIYDVTLLPAGKK